MTQAVKSARTSEDHNALAKRYEEAASQMQAKAHCRGLIRYYEQAAEANREMAEIHREIAAETK